jgi:hypothetical protein
MPVRSPKYRPRRISQYCPAMAYHAGVIHGAPYEVRFGPVAIASATNILSAQSIAAAGSTTTFLQDNTDPINTSYASEFPNGPGFGRCLQVVANGATTSTVTVKGRDFMGQPMAETFTLNGATPVVGVKAFKWIDLISWTITNGAGTTINVGTHDKLGLPYRMSNVLAEKSDGVAATVGTLVTPSLVDPATATTTDPRGTYDPNTTLDGSKYIIAVFLPNGELNSSGNGGLHGLAHYYA